MRPIQAYLVWAFFEVTQWSHFRDRLQVALSPETFHSSVRRLGPPLSLDMPKVISPTKAWFQLGCLWNKRVELQQGRMEAGISSLRLRSRTIRFLAHCRQRHAGTRHTTTKPHHLEVSASQARIQQPLTNALRGWCTNPGTITRCPRRWSAVETPGGLLSVVWSYPNVSTTSQLYTSFPSHIYLSSFHTRCKPCSHHCTVYIYIPFLCMTKFLPR